MGVGLIMACDDSIFIALPPNRLWGLFESAHALFEVRFIEWGEKEEML